MKKARRIFLGLWLALAIGGVMASTALASDPRCSGSPGYDVWQDTNKNGPTARTCGTSSASWRPKYSDWTTNLFFFANWDNRVSSVQTFNFTSHHVVFYRDNSYSYGLLAITNDDYVADMNDWNGNDAISSSKTTY